MSRPIVQTFPAMVTTAVTTAQAVNGALVINGTLLDGPVFRGPNATRQALFTGIQRVVSLTSAGNVSAVNITIVGTDLRGAAVTETRAGPNANTVFTAAEYNTVTSVSAASLLGTAMSVGTGDVGSTNWIMTNVNIAPFAMTIALDVTATVSVTVQDTPNDAVAETPTAIFSHAVLAAITADTEGSYLFPARFVRSVLNSSSGSGSFIATYIQAGI